jgi:signal transduction histidine kinase
MRRFLGKTAVPTLCFRTVLPGDKARSPQGGFAPGLSLVQTIITAHHGRFTIDSAVGRGTTVRIYLPS